MVGVIPQTWNKKTHWTVWSCCGWKGLHGSGNLSVFAYDWFALFFTYDWFSMFSLLWLVSNLLSMQCHLNNLSCDLSLQNGPISISKVRFVYTWVIRECLSIWIFICAVCNPHRIRWGKRTYYVHTGGHTELDSKSHPSSDLWHAKGKESWVLSHTLGQTWYTLKVVRSGC